MKFLSAFQRALLDFATYNYNRENESLSHWDGKMNDFQKKGPPKQPGAYETGNLHLGSEMLQVLRRSP